MALNSPVTDHGSPSEHPCEADLWERAGVKMQGPPEVPKTIWSDADFEVMGWHDVYVRAWAFEPDAGRPGRALLDLDYIVEWVAPADGETAFSFWITPATLVFDHGWDLTFHMDLGAIEWGPQIDDVTRIGDQPHGQTRWTVDGHDFTLQVTCEGFQQYLRRPPIWSPTQRLDTAKRGGVSFEEVGYVS